METAENPEEQMDCIDAAMNGLIEEFLSDIEDHDEFEEAASLLMDVFAGLIDEEAVDDTPDEDDPEEVKQEWIKNNLPKIREAMKEALDADPNME
jgi:hypothetical protein